ncbi:amidohydrolase family protein [Pseudonocardia acaciae]|uniref:amidohydrolase family protein n=1 Tax=Pseudonocardia acaciae TaxID=551276 RepID=UPI000A4A6458|nr:amidohydrolase family protein [Pseudonocardia acaciae]
MSLYDRSQVPVPNMLTNARKQAEERNLYDFTIVDVDSHHYEDTSTWQTLVPYIEDDGIKAWARHQFDRQMATRAVGAPIGDQELAGRILRGGLDVPDELRADRHDGRNPLVARTLWAMDNLGIDYTVLFPTVMLTLGLHPQVEVEVALARAYARWLTRDVLTRDGRIRTMVYLPFNDPAAALRMVREFADEPGVVGFMVTSVRYRQVHANEYVPVYAELQERGMPLAFHAAYNWHDRSMGMLNKFISVHALGFTTTNMIHLTNMVMNGIPERFPGLKVVWVESGLAWIPFLMQRLDNEYLMRSSEAPMLTRLPSEYMRDMYYSSQPMERTAKIEVIENTFDMINAERRLLYSSDYPHWDFDTPAVIYDLPFLGEKAKRRILGENAIELFGL